MQNKSGRIESALLLLAVMLLSVTTLAQSQSDKSNQLTNAEKKAGWKLLFDGKTLTGWRGFHNQQVPEGWGVADGCITKVKTGSTTKTGGDLITIDQFENFEFSVEWKLEKGGNSGIKYLVSESLPPTGRSGVSFEYQVLDDDNHPDAKQGIAGNRTAGSLYDLIAASKDKKLNPPGEFNHSRIVVKGNHIEHWLNGIKVVEFDRSSDAYKQRVAESKFKNTKGFGEAKQGHILLQDHSDAVWYRNIKIRALK
ncbi:MAG: DUF1080 domain-containing protein [Acidobacteria bacterium]|nr:DUF1080 domain-containing protein [Acidobacteriota bacterium]